MEISEVGSLQYRNSEHLSKTVPQLKQVVNAVSPMIACHGIIAGMMPVEDVNGTNQDPVNIQFLEIHLGSGRLRGGQVMQPTHGMCFSAMGL